MAIWAYELHLLGAAGAIGTFVTANVSHPASRESGSALFASTFQFQRHFVSYSPNDDRKPPRKLSVPCLAKFIVSQPSLSTNFCAICGSFLIREITSLRRLVFGGICQPCLRNSRRIRAASPMNFGFGFSSEELSSMNRFAPTATDNQFGRLTSELCPLNNCWERNPTAHEWIFSPCFPRRKRYEKSWPLLVR